MNIFFLDDCPKTAAMMMCDQHVVKMVTESAQMLSTAWNLLEPDHGMPTYKTTHKNHPCNVWIRECAANYIWLSNHLYHLSEEYTYRFGKVHGGMKHYESTLRFFPNLMPRKPMTARPICVPEPCIVDGDTVASYREYYNTVKSKFARWSKTRSAPNWFTG